MPLKPSYWFCCWGHRQLHYAQHDYRGSQRRTDQSYDRGYTDAWRQATPPAELTIPTSIWRGMIFLCHPDKYASEPGLHTLAGEITKWLLDHRPAAPEKE
jgi:hypothetical protein